MEKKSNKQNRNKKNIEVIAILKDWLIVQYQMVLQIICCLSEKIR